MLKSCSFPTSAMRRTQIKKHLSCFRRNIRAVAMVSFVVICKIEPISCTIPVKTIADIRCTYTYWSLSSRC